MKTFPTFLRFRNRFSGSSVLYSLKTLHNSLLNREINYEKPLQPSSILLQNLPTLNILSLLKRLLSFLLLLNCSFLISCNKNASEPGKTIAISQIIEHAALDEARKGILKALADKGYKEGKNLKIIYKNAQGNNSVNSQIAQQFAGLSPNAIIAISTPSAQAVLNATKSTDIPLIFTAVTDPIAAQLTESLDSPTYNLTGVTDAVPLQKQLELIKEFLPQLQKLAVFYNPGEDNSVLMVKKVKELAPALGITLYEGIVTKTSELRAATDAIPSDIQAIFVPLDNTIVSVMSQLSQIGITKGIPVFAADSGSIDNGALATLSFSYFDLGYETGKLVLRVLEGEKPQTLPIKAPQALDIYINTTSAQKLNIKIPEALLKKAKKVGRS
jgi:putative ABC transport system substrate-binding protein